MVIQRLQIEGFRNLASARLEPVPGLNRLIGPNGAGKTSVLEAVHYLATGRSFRRSGVDSLRRGGADEAVLFARVGDGADHRLGVRLTDSGRELRLDGATVGGFSALAGILKSIHYTPEGHQLASGGPGERRRFLDWGLFHVEPAYLEVARRYQRVLQQRNRWLKMGAEGGDPWAEQLAAAGEEIVRRRRAYVDRLEPRARALYDKLGGFGTLGMRLERGWPEGRSLADALARDRSRPVDSTRAGPHRGDLLLTLDGEPARDRA